MYSEKVVGETLFGLLEGHVGHVTEVGIAAGLGEPVDGLTDLFLAEFWLSRHGLDPEKG
jgi:hypothetical protein